MFRQDLTLISLLHIGVLAVQLPVDPDLKVIPIETNLRVLSDETGGGAIAIGVDGHTEIGVDQTVDFLEKGIGEVPG
jgi:hypothetical protein